MSNYGFGTIGQVLTSNGPDTMPSFQAAGGGGGSTAYFQASLTAATYLNATGDGTNISPVIFDSVAINQGSAYDNTTGIFTAPHDDFYFFSSCIRLSGVTSANPDLFMAILWSDFIARIELSAMNMADSGTGLTFPMCGGVYLTTGSQVSVAVAVTGVAPNVSILNSSDTSCNFTGFSLH